MFLKQDTFFSKQIYKCYKKGQFGLLVYAILRTLISLKDLRNASYLLD